MRRVDIALAGLILAAVLTGSCYQTPNPECALRCGNDGACPEGYRCASDMWCKRNDVPEEFDCGQDLNPTDAGQADSGSSNETSDTSAVFLVQPSVQSR